jgi:hypothetical protein
MPRQVFEGPVTARQANGSWSLRDGSDRRLVCSDSSIVSTSNSWIYDNNHITIDGQTRITFTEDLPRASSPTNGTCCGSAMSSGPLVTAARFPGNGYILDVTATAP